jgi:hypothetical protein
MVQDPSQHTNEELMSAMKETKWNRDLEGVLRKEEGKAQLLENVQRLVSDPETLPIVRQFMSGKMPSLTECALPLIASHTRALLA